MTSRATPKLDVERASLDSQPEPPAWSRDGCYELAPCPRPGHGSWRPIPRLVGSEAQWRQARPRRLDRKTKQAKTTITGSDRNRGTAVLEPPSWKEPVETSEAEDLHGARLPEHRLPGASTPGLAQRPAAPTSDDVRLGGPGESPSCDAATRPGLSCVWQGRSRPSRSRHPAGPRRCRRRVEPAADPCRAVPQGQDPARVSRRPYPPCRVAVRS